MQLNTPYVFLDNSPESEIDEDSAIKHLASVSKDNYFGFDTESDKDGRIKFIQIYSPVARRTFIFRGLPETLEKLSAVWSAWNVIGHNIQFDLALCKRYVGNYPNPVIDTFLLACELQEEKKGLKTLCHQYFGTEEVSWEQLFGDYDYNMTPEKWQYVANDPYLTYKLYQHYTINGAYRFVHKAHEIDIKAMIKYMESAQVGIFIDTEAYNKYLEQYETQVNDLQGKLNEYAGWEVRTSSTGDIKKLLFEQMAMTPPPITTEKGGISVSKEALSYLPDTDGVVSLITQVKESRAILTSLKNL